MASNLVRSRLCAAPPAIVTTADVETDQFLRTLPVPDFKSVADTKALWATPANDIGEGSVYPGTGGTAATYVVSAETYKYLKAHRY